MYNAEHWEEVKREIEELEEQKREITKRIHLLKVGLNQHGKHTDHKARTNTTVYEMFGKPLKALSKEEYKEYNRVMQRANRQKRKEKMAG